MWARPIARLLLLVEERDEGLDLFFTFCDSGHFESADAWLQGEQVDVLDLFVLDRFKLPEFVLSFPWLWNAIEQHGHVLDVFFYLSFHIIGFVQVLLGHMPGVIIVVLAIDAEFDRIGSIELLRLLLCHRYFICTIL